jgi:leucyl aminopeptidase
VFDKDKLLAMGCGGMIGVNQGSVEPPRMVKLTYTPRNPTGHLVLVGKGVMYDSGGISLKPSDGDAREDEDGHERRRCRARRR